LSTQAAEASTHSCAALVTPLVRRRCTTRNIMERVCTPCRSNWENESVNRSKYVYSEAASPRHGDEPSHITTMNDDRASVSTQHFGPARQSTKYGLRSEQSGWLCRNGELYGKDYDEQRAIALRTTRQSVKQIYEQSKGQVPKTDSNTLHAQPIEAVMQWINAT
jgi:hypothetical protein